MPALPPFQAQPQETPLNVQGQQALTELLQVQAARKRLQKRLENAVKRLTDSAGQLNDRSSERKSEIEKRSRRLQENGEDVDGEERDEYEAFQRKVDELTKKMDSGIRSVIDNRVWLDELPQAIQHVTLKTNEVIKARQRQTLGDRRQTGRNFDAEDDENSQNEDDEAADDEPPAPLNASDTPSALLRDTLSAKIANWNSKTPTDRYSNSNDYTGFYRTVYDARNPGEDAPPPPHASLWFAEEEGRARDLVTGTQRQSGRSSGDDEDSDLEVASERIRTKCPITFLPFKEPWTSIKCPHSFEKDAILEMLDKSTTYLPWTPAQLQDLNEVSARNGRNQEPRARREKEIGTPQIGCPECAAKLTAADLKPNPILRRKVKRILEADQRRKDAEEEGDEEDTELPPGTQRRQIIGLGSSPPKSTNMKLGNVKSESAKRRSGGVRQSQLSSQTAEGATIVDLSGSEDEDEEDEEIDDE